MLTEYVFYGVSSGLVYGLIGLGLVVVFRGSRIINFAAGGIGAMAGVLWYELDVNQGWPYVPAALAGVLLGGVIGLLTHVLVIGRLRGATVLGKIIATVAVSLFFLYLFSEFWAEQPLIAPVPLTGIAFHLGDLAVDTWRVTIAVVSLAVAGLLAAGFRWTAIGKAMRAAASDADALATLGFSPRAAEAATWTLGGLLAGLGAVLVLPRSTIEPASMDFLLIRGLLAAVIGGLTHPAGAMVGGLVVGLVESLTKWQWGATDSTGGVASLALFVLLVVALVFLPDGLLGGFRRRRRALVEIGVADVVSVSAAPRGRPPRPGPGLNRARPARRSLPVASATAIGGLLFALALVTSVLVSNYWAFVLSVAVVYMMIAASLVLLTGYGGQISLGHASLLGMGSVTAGYLMVEHDLGFLLAMVGAVAVTGLVSLVVGVPAIRVRGMQLATVTLVFGLMLTQYVFLRSELTGGTAGLAIPSASLFGIDLSLAEPRSLYQVLIVALAICTVVVRRILATRAGPALAGMRLNERFAQASGVRVGQYKLMVFAVSGAIAGLAGAFYALILGQVAATAFPFQLSVTFILVVVLGGLRSLPAAMLTAAAFAVVPEALRDGEEFLPLVGSVGVVLALMLHPTGIGSALGGAARKLGARIRGAA